MIVRAQGFRGQLCGRAVNKETVIPDSLRTDVRCVFVGLLGIDQFRIGLQQGFLQSKVRLVGFMLEDDFVQIDDVRCVIGQQVSQLFEILDRLVVRELVGFQNLSAQHTDDAFQSDVLLFFVQPRDIYVAAGHQHVLSDFPSGILIVGFFIDMLGIVPLAGQIHRHVFVERV